MNFLRFLVNIFPTPTAYAHCDIPCGVYDVHALQMAAHTVVRMTGLINDLKTSSDNAPFDERKKIIHDLSRLTRVKEEHGHLVEDEVGTLENDYFKPEHHKEFPELADLLKSAVKLSITTRQNIDADSADKLLEETQKIAEIFYKSKKLEPVRVPSGYPTGGEIVMHK
jgi:nickel superoxide dismutase